MDWQQVASLCIVTVTAILLGRHVIYRQRPGASALCGGDCACAVTKTTGPVARGEQRLTDTSGSGGNSVGNSVFPVA